MQTLEQFIKELDIKMDCKQIPERKDGLMEDSARHFRCFVYAGLGGSMSLNRGFRVYFSQGSGHTQPPTVADVLDCCVMDAAGFENSPKFEDWCFEYGYDTDSRKAEKIFHACKQQAAQLKRFLACDAGAYEALLFDKERG